MLLSSENGAKSGREGRRDGVKNRSAPDTRHAIFNVSLGDLGVARGANPQGVRDLSKSFPYALQFILGAVTEPRRQKAAVWKTWLLKLYTHTQQKRETTTASRCSRVYQARSPL